MVGLAYTSSICSTFLNYNRSGEILQMSQNTGFITFTAKYSNITIPPSHGCIFCQKFLKSPKIENMLTDHHHPSNNC